MDELLKAIDCILASKSVWVPRLFVSREFLHELMLSDDLIYCNDGRYKLHGVPIIVTDKLEEDNK